MSRQHNTRAHTRLQKALQAKLEGPGGGAYVLNVAGSSRQRGGVADLLVWSRRLPGCFAALEVKTGDAAPTPLQRRFLYDLQVRGARSWVVREVAEALHFEHPNGAIDFKIPNWRALSGVELMQAVSAIVDLPWRRDT